jgi:hypothetical protein
MKTMKKFHPNGVAAVFCALVLFGTSAMAQSRRQQDPNRRNRQQGRQQADAAPDAPGQGFDAFRMVRTRNIFDPDRRPIVQASTAPREVRSAPPTRSDYVALTGTMVTADKALAFFSGSRSEYNKVLSADQSIADVKITKITSDSIDVERAGKKITVAVGQTVPLDGSAPTAAPIAAPANAAPTSSSGTETAPSSPGAPPADASDVLKRMMEKRQQELK